MNAAANARLALLALSVALFAVVWSGDQQHRREVAATAPAAGEVSVRAGSAEFPVSLVADVPLPAALEPGVYRIVGTGGAVRTARFTVDDLLYLGIAVGSDSGHVPMAEDHLQRWYFIRLDEEPRDRSVETALEADAPFCRATKLLLAWAGESAGGDLRFLAGRCDDYMMGAARQWEKLARSAADDLGISIRYGFDLAAETAPCADAPFCRVTKLVVGWASASGAEDVRILVGECDHYMAGALRRWQGLVHSAAGDVKQAFGRISRPAKVSTGPRDDQRL